MCEIFEAMPSDLILTITAFDYICIKRSFDSFSLAHQYLFARANNLSSRIVYYSDHSVLTLRKLPNKTKVAKVSTNLVLQRITELFSGFQIHVLQLYQMQTTWILLHSVLSHSLFWSFLRDLASSRIYRLWFRRKLSLTLISLNPYSSKDSRISQHLYEIRREILSGWNWMNMMESRQLWPHCTFCFDCPSVHILLHGVCE